MLVALLIHCALNAAMENAGKVPSPAYRQERCYLSQDCPMQDALQSLYNLYSIQSCDMSHADAVNIPTDKSMLLLVTYFYDHAKLQSPPYSASLHSPTDFYDPVTYYIYALRKIVI